jgi:hypothetical protein
MLRNRDDWPCEPRPSLDRQAARSTVDDEQREQARQAPLTGHQRDGENVKAALAAAGVDAGDFGRFVNRPVPGVINPARFDAIRAMPILLQWLPQVSSEKVRETIVRHLAIKTKDGAVAEALIGEFRRPGSPQHKWVVADVLAYACDKHHFAALTQLAADKSNGHGRAPLVGMQWRIKTDAADRILLDAISDPDVATDAMSALRRRLGNAAARQHILPLAHHDNARVRAAAAQHLRRIDKQLTSSS